MNYLDIGDVLMFFVLKESLVYFKVINSLIRVW